MNSCSVLDLEPNRAIIETMMKKILPLLAVLVIGHGSAAACDGQRWLEMEIWSALPIQGVENEALIVSVSKDGCMRYRIPDHLKGAGEYERSLSKHELARLNAISLASLHRMPKVSPHGPWKVGDTLVSDGDMVFLNVFTGGKRRHSVWYPNPDIAAPVAKSDNGIAVLAEVRAELIALTR